MIDRPRIPRLAARLAIYVIALRSPFNVNMRVARAAGDEHDTYVSTYVGWIANALLPI